MPANADLRSRGWHLRNFDQQPSASGSLGGADAIPIPPADCPILLDRSAAPHYFLRQLDGALGERVRRWTIALGVAEGTERARLLRRGYGDALGWDISLAEVDARAVRIAEQANALHRWRRLGLLRLDLVQREAYVGARPLGLHPREFAVLWRLMENPGQAVEKGDLLRDVWQLSYVPETNSVAVHASRLRAKMASAGLAGWIQTTAGGGYRMEQNGLDKEFKGFVGDD
jgi:two-component system OmpR family response regulator